MITTDDDNDNDNDNDNGDHDDDEHRSSDRRCSLCGLTRVRGLWARL